MQRCAEATLRTVAPGFSAYRNPGGLKSEIAGGFKPVDGGKNTGKISGDLTGLQDKSSPIITRTLMRYLKDYGSWVRIAGAPAVCLP